LVTRGAAIAALVVLGVVAGGEQLFERWAAHAMVDAPNGGHATSEPHPGELRITVGPPAATLSVEMVRPKLPPRATIFVLPGITDDKEYMRAYADRLATAGYRAVLIDSRGHGRSTGQWLTWGVQEARDLSQLIDALGIDGPIGVLGHSYGGASAIQWAAQEPRVKAVMALGPFSSMRNCVASLPVVRSVVPRFVLEHALVRAGQLAGFRPDDADARVAARKTRAPILIVHGTEDPIVPLEQARNIAAAAPDHVKLVVLEGQDHENIAGDARLWPLTLDFLARSFP
jgi:pimeloyl-ACP methyl ester carboxylesterase